MQKHSIVRSVPVLFILALPTAALDGNPFAGIWKLNPARSKREARPPKSVMLRIGVQDNGLELIRDAVEADGEITSGEAYFVADGNDHRTTQNPDADTYRATRLDTHTYAIVFRKAGEEVGSWRYAVSRDGMTLVITAKYRNAEGGEAGSTSVFDKQQ